MLASRAPNITTTSSANDTLVLKLASEGVDNLKADRTDVSGAVITSNVVIIADPGNLDPIDLVGRRFEIKNGLGAGQSRVIVKASEQTRPEGSEFVLTLARAWDPLLPVPEAQSAPTTETGEFFKGSEFLVRIDDAFVGLALDHDNQAALTEARVDAWLAQITPALLAAAG